jgi:hypothetical protein
MVIAMQDSGESIHGKGEEEVNRLRLKKIESLPKRDQKALLHYLDALVQKNVAAG